MQINSRRTIRYFAFILRYLLLSLATNLGRRIETQMYSRGRQIIISLLLVLLIGQPAVLAFAHASYESNTESGCESHHKQISVTKHEHSGHNATMHESVTKDDTIKKACCGIDCQCVDEGCASALTIPVSGLMSDPLPPKKYNSTFLTQLTSPIVVFLYRPPIDA